MGGVCVTVGTLDPIAALHSVGALVLEFIKWFVDKKIDLGWGLAPAFSMLNT